MTISAVEVTTTVVMYVSFIDLSFLIVDLIEEDGRSDTGQRHHHLSLTCGVAYFFKK